MTSTTGSAILRTVKKYKKIKRFLLCPVVVQPREWLSGTENLKLTNSLTKVSHDGQGLKAVVGRGTHAFTHWEMLMQLSATSDRRNSIRPREAPIKIGWYSESHRVTRAIPLFFSTSTLPHRHAQLVLLARLHHPACTQAHDHDCSVCRVNHHTAIEIEANFLFSPSTPIFGKLCLTFACMAARILELESKQLSGITGSIMHPAVLDIFNLDSFIYRAQRQIFRIKFSSIIVFRSNSIPTLPICKKFM